MQHLRRLALFAAASFGPLAAQTPVPPPAPQEAPAPTVVRVDRPPTVALGQPFSLPPGEHSLVDLVERAAAVLGRNLLWPQTERLMPKGGSLSVTLNNPVRLTPAAFEELLGNLLYAQGFAIVPVDADKGVFQVIALGGPRARELMNGAPWRTPEEIASRPNQREYSLTTVRLEHINATVCTNALRPFFAGQGNNQGTGLVIGNAGNNEAIVLAGFTDQLCAAMRLIRECDQPARQPVQDPNLQALAASVAALQAQVKALQDQLADLQKAAGAKK